MLLGTVHSDRRGFRRTFEFLRDCRPDCILVELSPFALAYRKKEASRLCRLFREHIRTVSKKRSIEFRDALKHPRIRDVFRQLGLPFEYRASVAYARSSCAMVAPVDYSEFSRQWIETWPEMISAENVELLLQLQRAAPSVSLQYEQAALRVSGADLNSDILTGSDAKAWQERERRLADEILRVLAQFRSSKPLYIGGWWHLSIGGPLKTLRELLAVGTTSCFLLDRINERHVEN